MRNDQTLTVSLRVDAGIAESATYLELFEPSQQRVTVTRERSHVAVHAIGAVNLPAGAALEIGAALLRAGLDANLYQAFAKVGEPS